VRDHHTRGFTAERLLTTREVADRLRVNAETVLRWHRRGDLPSVRLSTRAIRFRETDVEAFVEARATPARGSVTQLEGRRPSASLVVVTQLEHEE
jgi:excisionase family DNA binding protein